MPGAYWRNVRLQWNNPYPPYCRYWDRDPPTDTRPAWRRHSRTGRGGKCGHDGSGCRHQKAQHFAHAPLPSADIPQRMSHAGNASGGHRSAPVNIMSFEISVSDAAAKAATPCGPASICRNRRGETHAQKSTVGAPNRSAPTAVGQKPIRTKARYRWRW